MSSPGSVTEIHYPDSDGKPMAESDLHRDWMVRIIEILKHRYQGEQVYVSGNLMLYYVEGNPRKCISPDAFVVKGIAPGRRRTYKLWVEGKPPLVVFETTSDTTRKNDVEIKPPIYESLGVQEYFLYDPTADYLDPPLRGYRLTKKGYVGIEPDATGRLTSKQLDMSLELADGALVLRDRRTGKILETAAEASQRKAAAARRAKVAERVAKENERREKEQERAGREAAEERVRLLEAQLARIGVIPEKSPPERQ